MVSLARKNLLEDIPRFLVAQAGIMFAVSLVTIQTGIFFGFTQSIILLIDSSHADIWIASETLVQLELTTPIPVANLLGAQEVSGVDRAEGLVFSSAQWLSTDGELGRARIVGFDPEGSLYRPPEIVVGDLAELEQPYTVMADVTDRNSLNVVEVGDRAQLASAIVEVVGFTQGNASIVSNPFVITSLKNANALISSGQSSRLTCRLPSEGGQLECRTVFTPREENETRSPPELPAEPRNLVASDLITFVLVKAEPGIELGTLKQRLETALPGTRAFTSEELRSLTKQYWQSRTGIGFVLGMGAIVGIVVGIVVVSQILYSSVSDHLKEFGTLKAIGASSRTIYGVIIEQALWMAILGYLPGMSLCVGLAIWASGMGISILITPVSAISVLVITIAMCVGSAIFAIQKVNRVDPAIVFKA